MPAVAQPAAGSILLRRLRGGDGFELESAPLRSPLDHVGTAACHSS
jgi:hypothetical protein